MSKYQEALNYLDWFCEKPHQEQQDLLQELIDKETPIKPINQFKVDFGLGNVGNCVCGAEVNYQQIYCDVCGQKLDWSEEDE